MQVVWAAPLLLLLLALSSGEPHSAGDHTPLSRGDSIPPSSEGVSLAGDTRVNSPSAPALGGAPPLEGEAEIVPHQAPKPRKQKKFKPSRFHKKSGMKRRKLSKLGTPDTKWGPPSGKLGGVDRKLAPSGGWGVRDVTAVVGRSFRLPLPARRLRGIYQVTGLPPWLTYTPTPPTIEGAAPQSAWGTTWHVRVTPVPPVGEAFPAGGTFVITVVGPGETGGPRARRSPDYPAPLQPSYDYADYEYEYDDYDPDYPEYSGAGPDAYDDPPPSHGGGGATPVYGVTASTVTVSLPRPPATDPPAPRAPPTHPPAVQPTPVVGAEGGTPTPLFRPLDPTQSLPPLVEPTRTLPPAPPATATTSPPPPSTSPHTTTGATPSTPPPPPDTTDHLVRNFPPEVTRRMGKLAWVGGFVQRVKVPSDTFHDLEDGDTRSLRLVLRNADLTQLSPSSWVQLDPVTQEIYALPLEDQMGHYVYVLEAVDGGGRTAQETVKIHVQQPRQARHFRHRYTATLRAAKKFQYDFAFSLDWQVRAVEKIASLFDNNTASVNVRSIEHNPTRLTWTNASAVDPSSTLCPDAALDLMNTVLFGDPEPPPQRGEPRREVVEHFKPEFLLKKIHVHYAPPCDARLAPPPGEGSPAQRTPNSPPRFLNQIDVINATAGVLYRRQVPQDACYDLEDGSSRNLRLRLLTHGFTDVPPHAWLQFDRNNQEFYGLPLAGDVGSSEFTLECVDSGGAKANDALTVVVGPSPLAPPAGGGDAPQPPAVFSLTLRHDYDALIASPLHRVTLVERIGRAFGDGGGEAVAVVGLERGSAVVRWCNATLGGGGGPCPHPLLQALHDRMLTPQGTVRPDFAQEFLPEFEVVGGEVTPGGACLAPRTPHHPPPPDVATEDPFGFDDLRESGVSAGERPGVSGEDYVLTFLIPSVLMSAMLLLAALAACCLYRHRRRYAKMSLTAHPATATTTTFVTTTGIPVILAEELDDLPAAQGSQSPPAKTPVIMKDEKPPLPPYRQSPPSPPRQYQQPPPPSFTNGSNPPRAAAPPPAYRKPTYVPP